ncbi:MAG: cobyric acid synthase [Hyphomicrobium sp.]
MFQGTGSDVGKSLIVAGLARHFANQGLVVRPFKPQNMSNNAAVTADGGEIGRAQALQARAARVAPSVHMNPVLLKPQSTIGSQVVVQGRVVGTALARDYQSMKPALMTPVLDSFGRLCAEADLVLVEGAGSASEINLRAGDIANMGFARAADVPVVLIGDIERGGVIASIIGTKAVISDADGAMIEGFLVNRFRGDAALFDDAMTTMASATEWAPLGLIPHFARASRLPDEDALGLDRKRQNAGASPAKTVIAVLAYPRISNFDDFDPLRLESDVDVAFVRPGDVIPPGAALVILPGSKATIADLAALRETGWDVDLKAHVRRGGAVLGICGGYQMLGRTISDPNGIEGPSGEVAGLGLLDVETVLSGEKLLLEVTGTAAASSGEGVPFKGYEMHIGRTDGPDCARHQITMSDGRRDGAASASGLVSGCYIHGLFADDRQRRHWLARIGASASALAYETDVERTLDELAEHLARHVDCARLLEMARTPTLNR